LGRMRLSRLSRLGLSSLDERMLGGIKLSTMGEGGDGVT
jgi:hypothetical protein